MKAVEKKLEEIIVSLEYELKKCQKEHDFLLIKSKFLGVHSEIKLLAKQIKDFSLEEKQTNGKKIQETMDQIEVMILDHQNAIHKTEQTDPTLPVRKVRGFKNIISQTIAEIKSIFLQMGYQFEESPEIETEFLNFTALNVHEKHPCRDAHQSFFLDNGKILRTHTSSIQNYLLKKHKNHFKCFTIGRTFRRDSDKTHVPMFHQIEGLCIGDDASLKFMFQTLKTLLANFFEVQNPEIRIRPSFFPFTEPSYEIDMRFGDKWLEILGSGIVHPNVFKFADRSPELGFAFGCGLERFAMIKHNILDVRELYSDNAFSIQKVGEKL